MEPTDVVELHKLTDEDLIQRARTGSTAEARACLETLYRRIYPKVSNWCLRICGDREEAIDLTQEVFLRVHSRLDSFRLESRFSTWLYVVARRVVINRRVAAHRRRTAHLEDQSVPDAVDPAPDAEAGLQRSRLLARFRRALDELDPLEARILYLHYVDGLTLKGITNLLGLRNKSGAKAYIVNGRRKLKRSFGKQLNHPPASSRDR